MLYFLPTATPIIIIFMMGVAVRRILCKLRHSIKNPFQPIARADINQLDSNFLVEKVLPSDNKRILTNGASKNYGLM